MEVNTRSKETQYLQELESELNNIIKYWSTYTLDLVHGGFLGKISNDNIAEEFADKGSVLNSRILWSFSAAYNLDKTYDLALADRAYDYLAAHFIDSDFGGVYWTVDYQGKPNDTKKQVYAVAFTIYALSEYFMARGYDVVKDHAIALYRDLVKYSYDADRGGYFEAFNREWEALDDLRLSDKDANEKKTMNTHLHILEAFTNLYRIWPDEDLKNRIIALIEDFSRYIVDAETARMILFFDEDWNRKSDVISYGHDIEASWLLQEAAEVVDEPELLNGIKSLAVKMAEASLAGVDPDGGLWYEQEPALGRTIKEKHWWVQAEAMVGFYNAWQVSQDPRFLDASLNCWNFVQAHILDKKNGEWFWGIGEDGSLMENEDKVGLWKCPYHNSRACIELIRRIKE
ncbi:MAG: N-acyl-D-glucosamine 2-epimerase [Pedobacter sp.]|nr:N-acyl-D-glucosamine 2-epimerase [Pedobacter sp.]